MSCNHEWVHTKGRRSRRVTYYCLLCNHARSKVAMKATREYDKKRLAKIIDENLIFIELKILK